jgi:transcriptional regulator with GAF, ATPase, and Fis domain
MVALQQEIQRVALSDAKILITGESGVGKELVAMSVHSQSARSERPFITVNCAGLPETLLESELFGHVKGSFTGAYRDKPGMLEKADEGSIFLDEIGEMSLRMQGMLLRFLETGELQKVGADRVGRHLDVRMIAATNRLLPDMVAQGQFREDLYYRINVINIHVPPLREHREDIPLLVDHFFENMGRSNGSRPRIMPGAYAALSEYSWPGNVRELANVIERMLVSGCGPEIGTDDVPIEVRTQRSISLRPKRERRRTVADDLLERMTVDHESFWTAVYPLYMQREITRANLRELVSKGLEEAKGNYKIVTKLFNLDPGDYKRFLNFLRKHECQVPFKEYR